MNDGGGQILINHKDLNKYKGIYSEEDQEPKYFEFGAHFPYIFLAEKLDELILSISPERRGNSLYDTPKSNGILC
jgi:hypothetical protein